VTSSQAIERSALFYNAASMQVEVYSDTVCPWCFIGKRRFALARQQRPQLNIEVFWRAFELNPDLATDGMDRDQYLMRKFGDPGRLQEMHENLREAGAALGIQFRFDLIRRMPNSRASHALLAFAESQGRQEEISEALFSAYFERGRDLGDPDVLVDVSKGQGLDSADSRRALDDPHLRTQVVAAEQQAREWGLSGVPTFIFDRRYAVSGAQSPEVFVQLFDRLAVPVVST
jgi:predicted DsbA family dithiol-disulfide isomerase